MGYSTLIMGAANASARCERPSHRPSGTASTVPMTIAAITRQKLITMCGQIVGHCAMNVWIAMTGPCSADECTIADVAAHASNNTASAPT
jgi:hypothetical protein